MIIKSKQAVAAEIFTTGWCNLNCNYCYIEKNDYLKELHKQLLEKLQSNTYITELKELYGDQLECLSLWGTEPMLSLQLITIKIPEIIQLFPKLKDISFSTNMILNPIILHEFIMKVAEQERKIKIKIQVSLDGPPEITDANRALGATKQIKINLLNVLKQLQNRELGETIVEFSFKPTWSIDTLRWLNEEEARFRYYLFFFDELIDLAKNANKNKNVYLSLSGIPTMAVPGTYSSDDGKLWSATCWQLRRMADENRTKPFLKHQLGFFNAYTHRLMRLVEYSREFFQKPDMFSCSGGRSQSQLGEQRDLHLCHRTLFMNHPEYVKDLKSEGNWDFLLQQNNRIELVKEKHIVNIDDQLEIDRVFYMWACFQNFTKHKIATGLATIKELVYSKQILPIYEDEHLAFLLSVFVHYCMGCPAENILQTGSIFTAPISVFRLFGNGALEIILDEVKSDISKRK